MPLRIRDIAQTIGGELFGDGDAVIHSARPLTDVQAGDLTFVEDEKHLAKFSSSAAFAALISPNLPINGKTVIRVSDPLMAFITIVQQLHPRTTATLGGIHPTAQIHPSAVLAPDVYIGAFVCIGEGCTIGPRARIHEGVIIGSHCTLEEDVWLYPRVVLYDNCVIGKRVIIHANAVIGADGFGYRLHEGRHIKVPQLGHVEIANDVEIGAGTTVDRATFGATRIGEGTKIDNLVMIGHNCQIGKHNLLVSQVGIAGSCTTGDYVVMAGQVGLADHLTIGDRALLGAKAGVHKDVPADARMLGCPATPDKEQMRIMMTMEKLPEIRADLKKIKRHLGLEEPRGE